MFRFGLVGCGRIAKRHAEILTSGEVDGARLGGVCDINQQRAKELSEKYETKYHKNMHDLARDKDIDAITILTPSGYHAENTIELAKYGKPIIVEKPMAMTVDECKNMIEECDKYGTKLYVVKQNRFNKPIVKLKEAIENDAFGKIVLATVRVRWSRDQSYYNQDQWRGTKKLDGGVLSNQAIHHIDMLQWMMGSVDEVTAYSTTALVEIEAEDTAVCILKFKNGALGVIEATTGARPKDLEGSISVMGEKGTAIVGGFAMNKIETWNLPGYETSLDDLSENPPNVYGFGHKKYYEHVVNSFKKSSPYLIDGLAGMKSVELLEAIYKSIDSGKPTIINYKRSGI